MNRIFSLIYEYKSITLNIKGFIYSLKLNISTRCTKITQPC